jgi:radical SAM protein with 4Fe4S-binding SPASM domain
MQFIDVILIIILLSIAAGVIFYIRRQKKSGSKCIGCPYGKNCSGTCKK